MTKRPSPRALIRCTILQLPSTRRLEYVPLWKKSLGLSVADENGDEDGDGDQGIDSPSPRFSTPSSSEFPGGTLSPNSTVSSPAVSSARFRSGVDSSGDDVVDAEASVWPTGLGGQRRTTRRARARKRRASAQAEALAAKERLEVRREGLEATPPCPCFIGERGKRG